MPALQGGTDEEIYELFQEQIVEKFDSESDALEFCVRYTLNHKYYEDV